MSPAPEAAGRFAAPETSGTAITVQALTTPDELDTLIPGKGIDLRTIRKEES